MLLAKVIIGRFYNDMKFEFLIKKLYEIYIKYLVNV